MALPCVRLNGVEQISAVCQLWEPRSSILQLRHYHRAEMQAWKILPNKYGACKLINGECFDCDQEIIVP
ncbi:hypothetical protein QQF64_005158 [Cirrhinus molitorella]|uniref:Uncharacterized protein n=1 Tax=Cirrhinus molitorella TaxID=172907 RepID=A0ABR3MID3_9TELE